MAVKNITEILETVNTIIGDSTDDSVLAFIEDITDTLNDYESRLSDDWKTKYEENDATWRKRYRDRFFGAESEEGREEKIEEDFKEKEDDEEEELKTFEDLFEVKED